MDVTSRPMRTLVARLDNAGDVLLAGPAVRAAAAAGPVSFVTSPAGAAAAALLPGVDDILTFAAPWILAEPPAATRAAFDGLVADLAGRGIDRAALLCSSHQSPLPIALICRLAGIAQTAAVSHEYPGSLLDARIPGDPDVHEVERNLLVTERLGCRLPAGDDGLLHVRGEHPMPGTRSAAYVAIHPGASVPARTWRPERWIELAVYLRAADLPVVVTGRRDERALTSAVAEAAGGSDLGGTTSLAALASILAGAAATVVGNTGPMHLSAAVGTPVVALFAPTVPPQRWRPWGVAHVLLGDLDIACRGCRARRCPWAEQHCLETVRPAAVLEALESLMAPVATATAARSSASHHALEACQ